MTNKEIFESLDLDQLSNESAEKFRKIEKATKGFTIENDKVNSFMRAAYEKIKNKKPAAIKNLIVEKGVGIQKGNVSNEAKKSKHGKKSAITKPLMKLESSSDYSIFILDKKVKLNPKKVSELQSEIENKGNYLPISVNKKLEVLVGHHRLEALKRLNMIVPYVIVETKSKKKHETKIRAILRKQGLKQTELYDRIESLRGRPIGMDRISKFVNGHQKNIQLETAKAFAKALGVTLNDIIEDD